MKKSIIYTIAALVLMALLGGVVFLYLAREQAEQEKAQLLELAEMDKREMENDYKDFIMQYQELKTQITNDSLVAQLAAEQERTRQLLTELQNTKAADAAEIARLKRELATLRAILKDYVRQIDSLNTLNQQLIAENETQREQLGQQQATIETVSAQAASLSEKVAIAAQLDATGISISATNKRGKNAKKIADVKQFAVSLTISRNVTAQAGARTIFFRIVTPARNALSKGGTFSYEGTELPFSMRRDIEYNGEETHVTAYYDVTETLVAGTYSVQIFADGKNIGNASVTFEK